jgi:hypothetical protein
MKITKAQLKQIIKEELTADQLRARHSPGIAAQLGPGEPPTRAPDRRAAQAAAGPDIIHWPGDVNAMALWQDLNILLNNWPDKEHPYYKDLRSAMEAYTGEEGY